MLFNIVYRGEVIVEAKNKTEAKNIFDYLNKAKLGELAEAYDPEPVPTLLQPEADNGNGD